MNDIGALISKLSGKHILKNAPEAYVKGFVAALCEIYLSVQIEKILQKKFFIPDDSNFDLNVYLQNAAELSVQSHIKQNLRIKNFAINKRINPPKDVDTQSISLFVIWN